VLWPSTSSSHKASAHVGTCLTVGGAGDRERHGRTLPPARSWKFRRLTQAAPNASAVRSRATSESRVQRLKKLSTLGA
jgi:hypothetical protein